MCCGQRRRALKMSGEQDESGGESLVKLLYYGHAPVHIRGPVTGRLYQFSREQTTQAVDARDAVSMLRTRLFRQTR